MSRVLVATVKSKNALQLKTRLSRLGHVVTGTVSDVKSLFQSLEKTLPDVILLDTAVHDGRDALAIGRDLQSEFNVPVVFLASQKGVIAALRDRVDGPFEHVSIPFRREDLHSAITLALFKHHLKGNPSQWGSSRDSLQKSGNHFSKAFHANPAGMIITQVSNSQILDVNESYQRIVGYRSDELIGNTGQLLGIHNDAAERQAIVSRLENEGYIHDYETTLVTKSGETRHVLFSLELIELEYQPCILASVFDITERKQAEEALRSRERFLALLNDMTSTILLSRDFSSTLQTLAVNMAKLLDADNCHITQWDPAQKKVTPAPATATIEQPYLENEFIRGASSVTAAVLEAGHALAVDDVYHSPHIDPRNWEGIPIHSMLGIPLIAVERKLGAALITFHSPHRFTAEEINRAEQAGNQVALALWNFQQSSEIQQRLRESHALTEIGRALSEIEHGGSDRVLQLIVDSALELIPSAEQAVIHIVDANENVLLPRAIAGFLEGTHGGQRVRMQMGTGIAGQVIQEGITINIPDVETDSRFLRSDGKPSFRSLMVAPVESGQQRIGTISVQSKMKHAFSDAEEILIKALGIDASIAIDNTRSFEATQQRLREVNALYGTIKVLAASLNPQELANDVVDLLQKNFGYYFIQLFLVDQEMSDLVLKAGSGETGRHLLQQSFRLPRGVGIPGHVFETGVSFFTNNVNDVVFFERSPFLPDTQFELAVPIKIEKQVVGILDIQDKPPKRLTESDLQLVTAVADQFAVALHKANLYTDLENAMQQEQTIRSQLIQSERLALVGRLLASVSHELNNPLQAIQNALFLLKEESGISMQGHQDLSIVLSETERMAALIERLRAAYRPIRGSDFHPVQLNNLIEDVYALISTHMRHKEISFEFFPETDLSPVPGISDQLRQVVLNLFLNAVEVMQPGGRLTIETRNLMEQGEVLFSVQDSGPGIDPQILPKIFDPFITSKHTGTGLGLTISHDILEQHRGRIVAENHPDGGAIFRAWLPMCEEGDR